MALDLYFHPRKTELDALRAPDYKPAPARVKAQRKAIESLLARHPACTLQGDALGGRIEGFAGELSLHPGYLHWCLHGEVDQASVLATVEAFEGDGWVCHDPQGAGYGSADRRDSPMRDWDDMIGAEFVGLSLLRDWGARLNLDFTLADGRPLRVDIMHFGGCQIPELSTLLKSKVCGVQIHPGSFDLVDIDFDNGQTLRVENCVPNGGTIGAKTKR
jgi:hypothetical protein